MILDTSYLLDLKEGQRDAFEKAVELAETDVVQRITAATARELYYGAVFSQSEEEHRIVGNLLLMYPLVPEDQDVALRAAELLAEADRRAGGDSGVDNVDGVIAAVADLKGEPVLTDDARHFETLGVRVETY